LMQLRRSTLFVPVGTVRYYAKAAASGADAVVLDLEDAVAPAQKRQARSELAAAHAAVAARWCAVRVNAERDLLADDIEASATVAVDEVLVPKVESVDDVDLVRQLIARHRPWRPALSILVETMAGVRRLPELLDGGKPITSVALGMEDLAAELLVAAPGHSRPDDLRWLHGELLVRTAATSVIPLGLLGELGNFTDLRTFRDATTAAWRTGYRGTYCIHPAQVAIANEVYAPDDEDVAWATEVIRRADDAYRQGRGVAAVGGRMVDAPTIQRAHRIIEYHEAVAVGETPAEDG
jgi:citrate lyase subunit beta / citryl-CoA lyase